MQTRYYGKTTVCGDYIHGVVYAKHPVHGVRRNKWRESTDVQKRLNERKAVNKFSWLVHNNFDNTAICLHPTYRNDCLPEDEERFKKDIRNFIARVGRLYKKRGIEFKWMYSACYSESGRPHIHMIFSGGIAREEVEALWYFGRTNADRLQFDECGVMDLSRYMVVQRHENAQRWSGSRNLVQPPEKVDKHRWSKKQLCSLLEVGYAGVHEFFNDLHPGYWLSEPPSLRVNPVDGSLYLEYQMYNPDSGNLEPYARREAKEKAKKGRKKLREEDQIAIRFIDGSAAGTEEEG
jgi:hypothetical protein